MGNTHGTGFNSSSTAEQVARDISLQGKNVLITGANTGLGKETSRVIAKMGAHVFMACRDMEKGAAAKEEISKQVPSANLTLLHLDLASLESIEKFVDKFNEFNVPLNILINNAGIMAVPYRETVDGFESHFGTNHVGHFYLTKLLLPKLKEGQPARVVCLSSTAHKMAQIYWNDLKGKDTWYKGPMGRWNAYGQSKTANILFAVELNRRMHNEGLRITANALHPGVISTELGRDLPKAEALFMSITKPFQKTTPQGAATTVYVATAPELEGVGGKYFDSSNEAVPKPYATNLTYATKLWDMTEELIAKAIEDRGKRPVAAEKFELKENESSEEVAEPTNFADKIDIDEVQDPVEDENDEPAVNLN